MNKKIEGIPRLLEISGEKSGLLTLGAILSVFSTLLQLAPFAVVYFITAELLKNTADPAGSNFDLIRILSV